MAANRNRQPVQNASDEMIRRMIQPLFNRKMIRLSNASKANAMPRSQDATIDRALKFAFALFVQKEPENPSAGIRLYNPEASKEKGGGKTFDVRTLERLRTELEANDGLYFFLPLMYLGTLDQLSEIVARFTTAKGPIKDLGDSPIDRMVAFAQAILQEAPRDTQNWLLVQMNQLDNDDVKAMGDALKLMTKSRTASHDASESGEVLSVAILLKNFWGELDTNKYLEVVSIDELTEQELEQLGGRQRSITSLPKRFVELVTKAINSNEQAQVSVTLDNKTGGIKLTYSNPTQDIQTGRVRNTGNKANQQQSVTVQLKNDGYLRVNAALIGKENFNELLSELDNLNVNSNSIRSALNNALAANNNVKQSRKPIASIIPSIGRVRSPIREEEPEEEADEEPDQDESRTGGTGDVTIVEEPQTDDTDSATRVDVTGDEIIPDDYIEYEDDA